MVGPMRVPRKRKKEECRDITFIRMLMDAAKARGRWSDQALDEGRPL
jgi:hypothetical protein